MSSCVNTVQLPLFFGAGLLVAIATMNSSVCLRRDSRVTLTLLVVAPMGTDATSPLGSASPTSLLHPCILPLPHGTPGWEGTEHLGPSKLGYSSVLAPPIQKDHVMLTPSTSLFEMSLLS